MKHALINLLVCPSCKGILKLDIKSEDTNEIIEGNLHCQVCDRTYLIKKSVPNMMPQESDWNNRSEDLIKKS